MTPVHATETPTRARYWVIVFAVTLAILSYIDRVSISQAAPLVMRDLHLSKEQMGYVFGAFALAYAIFEVPSGWLGDRLGARGVLLRIVLWWSAFKALSGWMFSFIPMVTVRFLFGAGEAGCFPNLTKAFATWLPHGERTRAQGILWTFARWGGAFTPPLVVLCLAWMNWRWAFTVFGILGVAWAVLFARWYRNDPAAHPGVNAAELALIHHGASQASTHAHVPWGKIVRSRSVLLLWVQYFCLTYPWYFYITWLPTWLQERHRLSESASANYSVLPLLLGGTGALLCGFLLAPLARHIGGTARARRIVAASAFVGASLLMALCSQLNSPPLAMIVMGLASFCNDLVMPPSWTACMDIGGRFAGTVSGSMNMVGNLAGFVAPVAGGYILHLTHGNWNIFLYSMAAVYLCGAFCWPFIDPVTPLELHPTEPD